MPRIIFLGVVLSVLTASGCVPLSRASTTRTQLAPHVPGSSVTVVNRNGAVEVKADPTLDAVEITTHLVCAGRTATEARQRLEESTIQVARSTSGELRIEPIFSGGYRNGDAASLSIRLPDADGADIRTANASIAASGLDGHLAVSASNGRITIEDHGGDATVTTSNGRIVINGVAGRLVAQTSNGAVRAEGVAGAARVTSSNGSINLHLDERSQGPLHVTTSNGGIQVAVGPSFSSAVTCRTSNGRIVVDDRLHRVSDSKGRRREREFVVGDGDVESVIRTSNGRITFVVSR